MQSAHGTLVFTLLLHCSQFIRCWLNAAYQHAFEEDFGQQEDSPACTVEGMYSVLSFADAINSTRPLLKACCSQLEGLELDAELGQSDVALQTHGIGYSFTSDGFILRNVDISCRGLEDNESIAAASLEEQQGLKKQVAAQIEQLLWLAYTLQLGSLVLHLHDFVRLQCSFSTSLLRGKLDAVFTRRVLMAAGVAGLPTGMQMLLNTVLGEGVSFAGRAQAESTATTLLLPRNLTAEQRKTLRFNALVQRSTLSLPQGAVVPVELDLFGTSTIKLGVNQLPVQLRIGMQFE